MELNSPTLTSVAAAMNPPLSADVADSHRFELLREWHRQDAERDEENEEEQ